MKTPRSLLVICICFVWAGAASAQESSEKRADIERLLAMTQAQTIGQQMSQAMVGQFTNAVRASNPNIPDDVLAVLPEAVNSVIEENMPELMSRMAGLYDEHFTHDDIRGLIEFYSSEVGRRFIEAQPAITQQSMAIGQAWGQSLGPEIQQRVQERLAQEGFEL